MCAQLYPTLCNPMDRNPPGSSDHGVFQARVLGWVAISYSRRSSLLWDWTHVSCISYIDRQILFHCATQESQSLIKVGLNKASKEWLVSKYTQACNSVYWRKHRVGRSNRRIGFLTNVHLLKQHRNIFNSAEWRPWPLGCRVLKINYWRMYHPCTLPWSGAGVQALGLQLNNTGESILILSPWYLLNHLSTEASRLSVEPLCILNLVYHFLPHSKVATDRWEQMLP